MVGLPHRGLGRSLVPAGEPRGRPPVPCPAGLGPGGSSCASARQPPAAGTPPAREPSHQMRSRNPSTDRHGKHEYDCDSDTTSRRIKQRLTSGNTNRTPPSTQNTRLVHHEIWDRTRKFFWRRKTPLQRRPARRSKIFFAENDALHGAATGPESAILGVLSSAGGSGVFPLSRA
jgi:hypothetical protein